MEVLQNFWKSRHKTFLMIYASFAVSTFDIFGIFRQKSSQWRKIARNKLDNLLVFCYLKLYFYHLFSKYDFSEQIAKSESIILISDQKNNDFQKWKSQKEF